jgi:hypothetical protein
MFDGFRILPRNGFELLVLIIARISAIHQDERSLEDQVVVPEIV